jgi:hypothetical protein
VPGVTYPLYSYDHSADGGSCAIIGGGFASAGQFPGAFTGSYFFSDLCTGVLKAFDPDSGGVTAVATGLNTPTSLVVGPDGAVYYLSQAGDLVGRVGGSGGGGAPVATGNIFLRNENSTGVADVRFAFGNPGEAILFCDWNGDGKHTPAVYRNGVFYLRDSNTTGVADTVVGFGDAGDQPICGDWNGDGKDTVGIHRANQFFLRNSNSTGVADEVITYGDPGDDAIVGDWNGDGKDTIGLHRGNSFYLRNSNSTGVADITFAYGDAPDKPLVGDWNGNGTTTVAITR